MRIILADHHAQPHWALKTLLEEEPEFDLVGEAVNTQDLLSLAAKFMPDLVLVDRELPGDRLQDLIATLHALKPIPIIIVMSSDNASSRLVLRAGADAFVSKVDDPAWLVEKLQTYAKIGTKEDANRNK